MLGSLTSFLFTRTTSIAALLQALPNPFWPGNWQGTFDDVLPYVQSAFAASARTFANQLPAKLVPDLLPIYGYLCEPDPRLRGYPGQQLNKIALERFMSKFDLMARRAAAGRYGDI
jgi:hypothetical protein